MMIIYFDWSGQETTKYSFLRNCIFPGPGRLPIEYNLSTLVITLPTWVFLAHVCGEIVFSCEAALYSAHDCLYVYTNVCMSHFFLNVINLNLSSVRGIKDEYKYA